MRVDARFLQLFSHPMMKDSANSVAVKGPYPGH